MSVRRSPEPRHPSRHGRLGPHAESRCPARARFRPPAARHRRGRPRRGHDLRQASLDRTRLRAPRRAPHRLHRHLFHAGHAALRSRLARLPAGVFRPRGVRIRRERRRRSLQPAHDRGRLHRRQLLRSRLLRLPRGRRCRVARPASWLALYLYAARRRPPCSHGDAGQPPRPSRRDQHALGEEPLPDAGEERDLRGDPRLPGVHAGARRARHRRLAAWEPSSAKGLLLFARCLPRALRQRRAIMSRRRVSDAELASWFAFSPVSRPVRPAAAVAGRKAVLRPMAEIATP